MGRIVDCSINFKPHTELGLYRYLGFDGEGKAWRGDDLVEHLDSAGVDMGGLIANVAANGVGGEELACDADTVAREIQKFPKRLFGWVGINPLKKMETLRYIEYGVRELGFKGVHCYPHWFGVPVNDRAYWPIYAKCCELGVPIALQVGSQTWRAGAKLCAPPVWLDDVAFDFPELKLIGLHIGSPWVTEMIMLCRNYENVFIIADAHPPSTWEPELVAYLNGQGRRNLDGVEKVMWGTDWPIQTFAQSLSEVDALGLEPAARDNLVGGNAVRVLGL